MTDIVILSGARTAIGTFGGALAAVPPIELATTAARAALERAGVAGGQIGHVVFGNVINTEPRDMYLSRAAAIIAEGEVMQLAAAHNTATTEDAYLRVINAKTAALFSAALTLMQRISKSRRMPIRFPTPVLAPHSRTKRVFQSPSWNT